MKIPLYRHRKLTEFVAEVDDEHETAVNLHRWSIFRPKGSKTAYARTSIQDQTVYLHRFVLNAGGEDEIDHKDGDGLNNRGGNLRVVTRSVNIKSAHLLPGRFGNATVEELDRELAEFENRK